MSPALSLPPMAVLGLQLLHKAICYTVLTLTSGPSLPKTRTRPVTCPTPVPPTTRHGHKSTSPTVSQATYPTLTSPLLLLLQSSSDVNQVLLVTGKRSR